MGAMNDEFATEPFRKDEASQKDDEVNHDVVFGEINEDGPDYHAVGGLGATALMLKTNLGLGVLSIPAIFDTLGMIPGIICIIIIAAITGWSQYMIGVFKRNHPEVYGIEDVAGMLWGSIAREFIGGGFFIFLIFVSASGMLSISIALNALSTHAACTAVFVAVAAIFAFFFASIQTLGRITWLAWIGVAGIITAILTLTIAVGIEGRPASAPVQEGPWKSDFRLFGSPSFTDAISACSSIVFSFAGTPGYFNIISEMRDPRRYPRAVFISQGFITAFYIIIGIIIYYFCGSYVSSPALGSAGATMKKVCYGLALPGLLVSTILLSHIPAKYLFLRILRGSKHLTSNSKTHWTVWLGCTFTVIFCAYMIASAIPIFGGLISLIGALFGTFFNFQPFGIMWLHDNWSKGKTQKSSRWTFMACWSIFVIIIGSFLMVAGTYGSIVGIIDSYNTSGGSRAFSCADNSNSV
ncbi:hypothetical protein DSL72_003631 [Monilinia vaccinii-corymbosi]|uniref:Amino acid transporter transmembrane domain-containing protein n=1 Tax=Monilinia vaccinii-corymbosi TaxID=61207 RepID=A0A8A3P2V2_9HELO|nr:hypothetical protein DSL72_003631 [Monilinia vaccinii-corymbosi]